MLKTTLLALTLLSTPATAAPLATPDQAVAIFLQTATLWPDSMTTLADPVLKDTSLNWRADLNTAFDQIFLTRRKADLKAIFPDLSLDDDPLLAQLIRETAPVSTGEHRTLRCSRAGKSTLDQIRPLHAQLVASGATGTQTSLDQRNQAMLLDVIAGNTGIIPPTATVAKSCDLSIDLTPGSPEAVMQNLPALLAPHFATLKPSPFGAGVGLLATDLRTNANGDEVLAGLTLLPTDTTLTLTVHFTAWRLPATQ